LNLKAPYKRQSSGGKNDKSGKKQTKAQLKTGHEYIRGIAGSNTLVSSYGTLNSSKTNTNKTNNSGTYGRSNTLGKSHSFLGGGKNNNNGGSTLSKNTLGKSSSSTTGRSRSIFSLRKK